MCKGNGSGGAELGMGYVSMCVCVCAERTNCKNLPNQTTNNNGMCGKSVCVCVQKGK